MELIKRLAETPSVAGYEKKMKKLIAEEVKDFCDRIYEDNFGNLICVKGSGSERVLFNTPISENGFFITDIKEERAKLSPIGTVNGEGLGGKAALTLNGCEGIFVLSGGKEDKKPSAEDYEIEFFVSEGVKNGDIVAVSECAKLSDKGFYCNSAGIIAGIYALISIMKKYKKEDKETYFVFSVQDNLGFKGAKVATQEINPQKAVVIGSADTSNKITKIEAGKGAVLRIKDKAAVFGKDVIEELSDVVNTEGMQREIADDSAITNNNIMFLNSGIPAVNINIPVKHYGSCYEAVCFEDIKALVESII